MSKRQRHRQFYRDTEDEPDSELEEEEDDDEDEEVGLRDPVQKVQELQPSPSIAATSTTPRKVNTQVMVVDDIDDGEEVIYQSIGRSRSANLPRRNETITSMDA